MKRLRYIIIGVFLAVAAGCTKDFLKINTDPNNPQKATLPLLLTASEEGLTYMLGFSNSSSRGAVGLTEVLAVYVHQVTVREDQDQYGAMGDDFNINGAWNQFYTAQKQNNDLLGCMENLNVLIRQADSTGNHRYSGIGRILKAYGMSMMVDAFADVPYSQANQYALSGIGYPIFDKGATIYPQLFTMLDQGIALLSASGGNSTVPGADDVLFGGDTVKWRKAGNSIKLKMLNQVRLVQNVSAATTSLTSAASNLIGSWTESIKVNYTSLQSPDDRNPGYNDYYATQKSHYMSPWFYSILKGYNPNILTGVQDPRIPYYFYNQNDATDAAQNTTEYRDGAFISIYFGSQGPNRDKSQDNSMTVFGIYPVGGKYDDGSATPVNNNSASGAAPLRLLTYADVLYIQAELMLTGNIPGDPRATLLAAIQESFHQVDLVASGANKGQSIPILVGSTTMTNYVNAVMAQYDARSTTGKLEMVLTQKWISSFGFSCDLYTDYRRTGYPVMFDPNNPAMAPGGFVQPPINGDPTRPGAQPAVKVALSRGYPLSLPWPINELNVNKNAPAQKNPAAYPVFWKP
ncbi:SusD-like starch-binding protein associating with outer membrane [Chitinophaga dinghuensis]|uniref:SusD-like starch-binding protein associating with outer membrane n=1 Tax=Chitinophaga dinghuensis TaxID=1539050 RepID=A0A327VL59_9BACT|nr:SusD/RagB family nutrient-binding outer membrane lipoprotein [Chitinophaga dinghuensis]RAJ75484.1 SusD-like starch-binding protein associating with outer membrane [Chitinophaga dinghuensis]